MTEDYRPQYLEFNGSLGPSITRGPKSFEEYIKESDIQSGLGAQTIYLDSERLFRITRNFGVSRLYYGPENTYGFSQTARLNFNRDGRVLNVSQSAEGRNMVIFFYDSVEADLLGGDLNFDFPFGVNQLRVGYKDGNLATVGYGTFGGVLQFAYNAGFRGEFVPETGVQDRKEASEGDYSLSMDFTTLEDRLLVKGLTVDTSEKIPDEHIEISIPRTVDKDTIMKALFLPELLAAPESPETSLDKSWIGIDYRKLFGIEEVLPPELEKLFTRR